MNSAILVRAALLSATAMLLPACGDVLDSPEDGLPPPVNLANPAPPSSSAPLNGTPTKAQLLGTWRLVRDSGVPVPATQIETLTFFSDGTYLFGGNSGDSDCDPTPAGTGTFANYDANGNGVEFGELNYNQTNGRASAGSVFFIDTNGDCGPHLASTGATQDQFTLAFVNDVLQVRFDDGFTVDLERVQRGSGVIGSWYLISKDGRTGLGTDPEVVSFLADGRYVANAAVPQADDDPGTQVGRYAVDAAGNLTISDVVAQTTREGFGSGVDNTNERLVVNSSGQLVYTHMDSGDAHTNIYAPLPLASRFDTTLLQGTFFEDLDDNGSIVGEGDSLLLYFGADGKFLFGGLRDDPTCASDYASTGIATEPNGNGYESGTFTADATTGRVKFNITSETDGACGAYSVLKSEDRLYLATLSSTRITVQSRDGDGGDEDPSVIRAVPSSANSLFGAWRGTTGAGGTTADDFLVAYLEDGTAGPASGIHLAVDANPGSVCSTGDSGPRGGVELGQYLFDGSTIGYTATTSTLCQTRFNPGSGQTIVFSNGGLTYTDNQASTPAASFVYNKLTRP